MEQPIQVAAEKNPFVHYGYIVERRDEQEKRTISHIKRFMECLAGDPDFRRELKEKPKQAREIAGRRGLDVDPKGLVPLWRKGFRIEVPNVELDDWPLTKVWVEWIQDVIQFRVLMRDWADMSQVNPRFHAWRLRQVARADSELGDVRKAIVHAILSFELSSGCSVGCWFCGLGAEKFKSAWPHTPENSKLWREVLQECNEAFGQAAQTAFCYHATEPTDNPEYLDFMDDFFDVVGVLPQTTSAMPLKDLDWTRRLLAKHHEKKCVPSRFSILSLNILHKVHELFSPEELFGIELLLQQKGSILSKAKTGYARDRASTRQQEGPIPEVAHNLGTIACVSGFLVNMGERTIKLVSPCKANEHWPMGYRVHYQGTFRDAREFRAVIDDAVETCMPLSVNGTDPIAFRPALEYKREESGFTLKSCSHVHRISGYDSTGFVGDLIASGNKTAGEVLAAAIDKGADIFAVTATIRDMFNHGFLEDDPALNTRFGES